MSSSPAGATPRRLLLNGVHMSASFAGLEGCVFATINIAAAVVPPATAHFANGMLYLFFSVGALVAPLIVQRIGAKRSLVVGMSFCCFFMAGYIVHTRPVLVLVRPVGGFAGAVLWVAQGVYFTRQRASLRRGREHGTPTAVRRSRQHSSGNMQQRGRPIHGRGKRRTRSPLLRAFRFHVSSW